MAEWCRIWHAVGAMTVDLAAAASFLAGHGRLLDRRRFELLTGPDGPDAVLAAVDGYRNADGGYGWGLEPDLRAPESQPGGALHAFEVFDDIAPATTPRAAQLCDWLASVTLPDGGLPFALPVPDPAACAPFWAAGRPGRRRRCRSPRSSPGVAPGRRHDPAVRRAPVAGRARRVLPRRHRRRWTTRRTPSSWPSRCSSSTPRTSRTRRRAAAGPPRPRSSRPTGGCTSPAAPTAR